MVVGNETVLRKGGDLLVDDVHIFVSYYENRSVGYDIVSPPHLHKIRQ
jgi:hypothetical protein